LSLSVQLYVICMWPTINRVVAPMHTHSGGITCPCRRRVFWMTFPAITKDKDKNVVQQSGIRGISRAHRDTLSRALPVTAIRAHFKYPMYRYFLPFQQAGPFTFAALVSDSACPCTRAYLQCGWLERPQSTGMSLLLTCACSNHENGMQRHVPVLAIF